MHWPCFCNPFQDRRTDRAGRSALRFAVMDEDLGRIQQGRADARKTPCGNAVTSPCAPPALRAVSRRTFPPAASIVNTGCSPSSSAVTKSSVPFADQTGEPGQRSQSRASSRERPWASNSISVGRTTCCVDRVARMAAMLFPSGEKRALSVMVQGPCGSVVRVRVSRSKTTTLSSLTRSSPGVRYTASPRVPSAAMSSCGSIASSSGARHRTRRRCPRALRRPGQGRARRS